MPGIKRTTKGTFEFRIECGDDVRRRALSEVLEEDLVLVIPLSVPQFTIKSLWTALSVARHEGNTGAVRGLTQAIDVLLCYMTAEIGHYGARVNGERLEALRTQSLRQFYGEQDVRCLRLAIRAPFVIRLAILEETRGAES